MAAISPLLNNASTVAAAAVAATPSPGPNGGTPSRRSSLSDAPRQNLRGLNKPKCSKCGNVARSRCPYQSCKSCCAKAQNPCHIHVLKSNSTLPDKAPSSSSPSRDHTSTNSSPSGTSLRVSSLRQIPNNFAHFIGAQGPLRARRPLTRKDAAAINAWRFSKLKEYNERNIEAGNEAFDRYMLNVSLLEEAFSLNSKLEGPSLESVDEHQELISGIKVKLKASFQRAESCRRKMQDLVGRGLSRLRKWEFDDEGGSTDAYDSGKKKLRRLKEEEKCWADRASAVNELVDKLNKARNEDELKSCLEIKLQLFGPSVEANSSNEKTDFCESKDAQMFSKQSSGDIGDPSTPKDESSSYALPRLFTSVEISQETLCEIERQFSSIDQTAEL